MDILAPFLLRTVPMLDPDLPPRAAMDALRRQAHAILPDDVRRYYEAGAADGVSVAEAQEAWAAIRLRPRALRDVAEASAATTVLGTPVAAPVLVAPSAAHRLAHPDGEVATARGVADAGSLHVLSTRATARLESVAQVGGPWWMQVYVLADRGLSDEVARRAAACGARALVLTGDTPVVGHKPGSPVPAFGAQRLLPELEGRDGDALLDQARDVTPADVGRLGEVSGLPVVVKGVLRSDDARACADAGAAGVVVSNHGGRQLDGAVPAPWALPEVVEAVGGEVEVYADGGVRTGRDVLAALALGARAVLVGRPVLWALATGGSAGVAALLRRLAHDTAEALALAGCVTPTDAGPDLVWQGAGDGRTVSRGPGTTGWAR